MAPPRNAASSTPPTTPPAIAPTLVDSGGGSASWLGCEDLDPSGANAHALISSAKSRDAGYRLPSFLDVVNHDSMVGLLNSDGYLPFIALAAFTALGVVYGAAPASYEDFHVNSVKSNMPRP